MPRGRKGEKRSASARSLMAVPKRQHARRRGVLGLSQAVLGPDRYGCSRCFETMPSAPELAGVGKDRRAIAIEVLARMEDGEPPAGGQGSIVRKNIWLERERKSPGPVDFPE
jgi:hypothetical protein